jgi:hypothetical protein
MTDQIFPDYDIRPIAAAVIVQAVKEAREGDRGARAWLMGDGVFWLDVCGLQYDPEQLARKIKKLQRGRSIKQARTRKGSARATAPRA